MIYLLTFEWNYLNGKSSKTVLETITWQACSYSIDKLKDTAISWHSFMPGLEGMCPRHHIDVFNSYKDMISTCEEDPAWAP